MNEHAFPTRSEYEYDYCGMSLLDYFATKAMQSFLVTINEFPDEHWMDGVATDSYKMAKAMLKAKEINNENI